MRLGIEATLEYYLPQAADVLLAMEVLPMGDQTLIEDMLTISGTSALFPIAGEESLGRRTWMEASGHFSAHYRATVEINRPPENLPGLIAAPCRALPSLVVPYLFPSRYCEADRFEAFVRREFPNMTGGDKVQAMADWIFDHVAYIPGTSDITTTAGDTFIRREGVCRDFSHLLACFVRAAGIPARVVSAYALQLDPPDFHAVVEVWLSDSWHLVDATRLAPIDGLARIAVGRDATDISFMTIFGTAQMKSQSVTVQQL